MFLGDLFDVKDIAVDAERSIIQHLRKIEWQDY
jgi:hypothetical protein